MEHGLASIHSDYVVIRLRIEIKSFWIWVHNSRCMEFVRAKAATAFSTS